MIDLELLKQEIEIKTGLNDISKNTRKREYIQSRALFFYLARKNTPFGLSRIGKYLGKDHTTVVHAFKMIPVYLKDPGFKKLYDSFKPVKISKNIRKVEEAEQEIMELRKKVAVLQAQLRSREGVKLKASHRPLLEIINNIPVYHIDTVKMRLVPIIKMLEKPSMHNYLPQTQN